MKIDFIGKYWEIGKVIGGGVCLFTQQTWSHYNLHCLQWWRSDQYFRAILLAADMYNLELHL